MKKSLVLAGIVGLTTLVAPSAKATTILVGQCVEFAICWEGQTGGTPWSDTLTLSDLTSLGLGSTVDMIAAQTAEFVMQLGVTTMTFTTGSGPVTETLGVFSGGDNSDPCNFCEIDIVGTFAIPGNATGATISGSFGGGGNESESSAGMNVCLGSIAPPCAAASGVPEPGTLGLVGMLLAGTLAAVRLRRA